MKKKKGGKLTGKSDKVAQKSVEDLHVAKM